MHLIISNEQCFTFIIDLHYLLLLIIRRIFMLKENTKEYCFDVNGCVFINKEKQ